MLYIKISQNFSAVMSKMLKIKHVIGLGVLSYPAQPIHSHIVCLHYTLGGIVCSCCLDLARLMGV